MRTIYPQQAAIIIGGTTMFAELTEKHCAELELNDGKGWQSSDLSFLARLPHLKALRIVDSRTHDVTAIHSLANLRSLEVLTYCNSDINFDAFPLLEACRINWRRGAISMFKCVLLKSLVVNGYDQPDLVSFAQLRDLESLAVMNSKLVNLEGIEELNRLRSLRLGNLTRLSSLAGIGSLVDLEELDINSCRRIHTIDELVNLFRLRKLGLNDGTAIESLKPLMNLKSLEEVIFYGSTNVRDGDLSPLLSLVNLSRVSFQDRRHYSHRRQDFKFGKQRS